MGKLFVGNISWQTTEEGLAKHFEVCGQVKSAKIIKDRDTGKSRGFAFIEMDESAKAIEQLDKKELDGRTLNVKVAEEKKRN